MKIKATIIALFILLPNLVLAEIKYNPFTGQWERAPRDSDLKYNPPPWDVETNSAAQLTTGTFNKMKSTKNLSQALHQTKIEMINDSETSHPIFWAPFVLIGNVSQSIN